MARLDRLGDAKEVAQIAAALGREFPFALLAAVAPLKDTALREGLGRLVQMELVYQRGLPPKAFYTFKHALVQDTAYQSLLETQRRELHGRIADALTKHSPERVANEPEAMAQHCEQAGRVEQAISFYLRAGQRATQSGARVEAIDHLHKAIELLVSLPKDAERNERELQLLLTLGPSLFLLRGFRDPEAERVYERARALCSEIAPGPELVRALLLLSQFYSNRGEIGAGIDLAEQALALAEESGEDYPLLVAHCRLGVAAYAAGEFSRSHEHLEQAVGLHQPGEHRSLASVWGQDWGIIARIFDSLALWYLGHPDRARRLCRETIELARAGDPLTLGLALTFAAGFYILVRENERARELAEECLAIGKERLSAILVGPSGSLGRAIGGLRGIEELRRAVTLSEAAGLATFLPGTHSDLAEVYRDLGRTDDALAAVDAAFASRSEIRNFDARLYQIRGEVLLQSGARDEAESCFRQALEIARTQEAKPFHLRAGTSLGRLLRDQGRRDEARALLQPIYDWFTEGFGTAELKDAKELLDEL